MKPFSLKCAVLALFCCMGMSLLAQTATSQSQVFDIPDHTPEDACTSIMAGKDATVDGSTITSHTCDSNYRTWTEIVAATNNNAADAKVEILKGYMHTEYPQDRTRVEIAGYIPQAPRTYAYFNTSYPCMNETGLAMGETTISGRRDLVNRNGLFNIEELQKIALQRTTTARDAITLMGALAKEYGYGDSGESLTIADKDEVWLFEIFGAGSETIGAVWAAQRIPDNHVSVSANIPRISSIDLNNPDYFMASENVFSRAKELGYWDGKEPFVFWKAYGGGRKAYSVREFFILSTLAPSLNLNMEGEELPLSVAPDHKVTVQDIINLQKSWYEGTEFDPIKNLKVTIRDRQTGKDTVVTSPYANPWLKRDMANMINAQKEGAVTTNRLIAVPQCSYFTVIQVRGYMPEPMRAITWFGFDNPGQSPRIPIYSGTLSMPKSFMIDGQWRYREDAAIWSYRRANKLSSICWGQTRQAIEEGVALFETKAATELPDLEARAQKLINNGQTQQAREMLTDYVHTFCGATQQYWWDLGDQFWMLFARGI